MLCTPSCLNITDFAILSNPCQLTDCNLSFDLLHYEPGLVGEFCCLSTEHAYKVVLPAVIETQTHSVEFPQDLLGITVALQTPLTVKQNLKNTEWITTVDPLNVDSLKSGHSGHFILSQCTTNVYHFTPKITTPLYKSGHFFRVPKPRGANAPEKTLLNWDIQKK